MISALAIGAVPATVHSLQDTGHGCAVSGEFTFFSFRFDVNRLIQLQSLLWWALVE
jgi:hypothetical protein